MQSISRNELVNSTEIGRRLGLSGERVRQLAKADNLPPAVGRSGRTNLWRWDDIRAWAIAVGRLELEEDGEKPLRRPPSVWTEDPYSGMHRTVDEVIRWDSRGDSIVHVRIWEPKEGIGRPVVLLGNLDDNPGASVTNRIEDAAEVARQKWLGVRGYDADWFDYWPGDEDDPGSGFNVVTFTVGTGDETGRKRSTIEPKLRDPGWHVVTHAQVERLIGDEIELYQAGTYTSMNARAFTVNAGRVNVVWDPNQVREDLQAIHQLNRLVSEGGSHSFAVAAHVLARIARDNHARTLVEIAEQPQNTAVRKSPLPLSAEDLDMLQLWVNDESVRPRFDIATEARQAVYELRCWLHNNDPESASLLLPGTVGWAWPELSQAGVGFADDDPPNGVDPTVAAVRRGDLTTSCWLWRTDPRFRNEDHVTHHPSLPLPARGELHLRYLDSVAWWGLRPEDTQWVERHNYMLSDEGGRTGYDPWGRLVILGRSEDHFVVKWPTILPPGPLPDELKIVGIADPRGSAVFIESSDGRLDLLPAEPRDTSAPSFAWGYGGAGPHALAGALRYLCTGETAIRESESESCRKETRRVVKLLSAQGPELMLTLGDIRQELAAAKKASR